MKTITMSKEFVSKKKPIDVSIKRIIIEKTGIEAPEITDAALFADDLGIDSLDLFEIMMQVEKEFDIKIPDEDAEKMRTVGSLIIYIKNKN
jgi:acyl carrier protein